MKPSKACKLVGLKSLAELSEITGESTQTLRNWSYHRPEKFKLILIGAVAVKLIKQIEEIK